MIDFAYMNKTALGILTVLVVAGGWWFVQSSADAPVIDSTTPSTESVVPNITDSIQADDLQAETIMISGSEFSYDPATFSAKIGQPVTVVYKNIGKYPHDFVIDELSVKSQVINAGETATFKFVPSKSGSFSFYCSLPNHREKGMSGMILVN